MVKVSICVPVYNVEQFIERCIESILNQTFNDIEVLIVNDCTPDSSMAIVNRYAAKDSRIRIVEHEYNRGLMRARQTGYKAAKGDYITFCDSDDTLELDAIEKLLRKAVETGADVVSGELYFIPTNGKAELHRGGQTLKYGGNSESAYKSLLLGEIGHNLCSKLFKREILQNYEYETFDNFVNAEDGYLFYQVVNNSKLIVHTDNHVYNYYQNMDSSTQKRLTMNGIRSILLLLLLRKKIMVQYKEIAPLFSKFITNALVDKYKNGYRKELSLDNLINEYGLSEFVSNKYMLINYGFFEFSKLWTKKNIYPLARKLVKK